MGLTFAEKRRRREVKSLLYSLERQWGVRADLYLVTKGAPDFDTGQTTDVKTVIDLPKFVSFQVTEGQKFEYDLSFVAANKNFTYGNLFEVGDRVGFISAKYLPDGFELGENDYIVYRAERYDVKRWDELDVEAGLILHLRHLEGTEPGQILSIKVFSDLTIEQDITSS